MVVGKKNHPLKKANPSSWSNNPSNQLAKNQAAVTTSQPIVSEPIPLPWGVVGQGRFCFLGHLKKLDVFKMITKNDGDLVCLDIVDIYISLYIVHIYVLGCAPCQ